MSITEPNIRTNNIPGLNDKSKADVAILVLRIVEKQYRQKIQHLENIIDSTTWLMNYCEHCYTAEDKNNCNLNYYFCKYCDKRGYCQDCTIYTNFGIIRPNMCGFDDWVCPSCLPKHLYTKIITSGMYDFDE